MPFPLIPLAISGISALAGALSNKGQTSKGTSSTQPTLDPQFGPLQQMLLETTMRRLKAGSSLPAGYAAQGVAGINRTYDLAGQSLDNTLTARGLGTSPVAGTTAGQLTGSRAGEIARFQTSLPLLERDMQQQDLGLAGSLLQMGRGSTTTQTQTQPGNMFAGGATSLGSMLAYLYGRGSFGGANAAAG